MTQGGFWGRKKLKSSVVCCAWVTKMRHRQQKVDKICRGLLMEELSDAQALAFADKVATEMVELFELGNGCVKFLGDFA